MAQQEKVQYWIDIAQYDLDTALAVLGKQSGLYNEFSDKQKDHLDVLEPLNIEARYPTHKELILKSLSQEKCMEILQDTKELFQWIKQKLKLL